MPPQDIRRVLGLRPPTLGPLLELVCLGEHEHISYAMTSPAAMEARGHELRCGWDLAPRQPCNAYQRPTRQGPFRGMPPLDPRPAV